jgi:predicted nuclease with TOPRIM domain
MFLYKNPGLKKFLRYKCHSWGVQTLEEIIKKEQEIKAKLQASKEKLKETGEKLKEKGEKLREKTLEQKEKIKEKISDLAQLNAFKNSSSSSGS